MYTNTGVKKSTCTNCGQYGHSFRQCIAPVTSFGMIIFRHKSGNWNQAKHLLQNNTNLNGLVPEDIEYLLIQRRDSLGFVEIMRGKYRLQEIDYIRQQIRGMTQTERKKLLELSFDELWSGLWGSNAETNNSHAYRSERETSRVKLETLKTGYVLEDSGRTVNLRMIFDEIPSLWDTPEWGFPKGRRDQRESEYQCAIREVYEETGLTDKDIIVIRNLNPIQESFFGSNHIHYCHKYYISYMPTVKEIAVDTRNSLMCREIGNIGWFSLEDALRHIRPDNIEKREILLKTSSLLRNYCPLHLSPPHK
jgi:8-oxo-dGTP pyrophosphatase MutT (NUDIX family)